MKYDDLLCMRRGKVLATVSSEDYPLLGGFRHQGAKKQRALLLLHGFSSTPAVFRELFPHLSRYDAVIAPVLPGHGQDLASFAEATATAWMNAAEQHCAALCQEYAHVDVLGLSLGGLLACQLSQRFSLNHLYLLAPALELQLNLPLILPLARFLQYLGFNRVRANAGNLYTNKQCEIAYRQLPLSSVIEILNLIKQFQFCLPLCPCDVFLGKYDAVVDSEGVAALFAGASHIKIHRLANSAHVLPLDGDLELIIQALQN